MARDADPTRKNPGQRSGFCSVGDRPFILVAAILASALGFIDGTLISIALPAMRDTLGATLVQGLWINNAYLLPLSALILLGGSLGDRFGTARVFAGGVLLFMLASLACAIAPTAELLIAGRVLKGIGAALMIPGSLALIAKAYPAEGRGRAIGIWAAASALTTALGPILGGIALYYGGPEVWRWLFAINLPLGAVVLALIHLNVTRDSVQPTRRLDMAGALLISAALALLAVGLTGISPGAGADWRLVALATVAFAGFVAWEARAPHPMVPLSLFASPAFAAANLATGMLYFSLTTILFFLPMTMIAGWGAPETLASLAFVPLSVFITGLSARAGAWADLYGPGTLIGGGGALVAVAFALLGLLAPLQSFWISVLPGTTLMGLGMALVVSPLSTAIMGAVSDERAGTASGINNAVSRVAGLVAVAAMGGLAASVYGAAGGGGSFGAFSDASGHAGAMTTAFSTLAWITAGLSAASAAVAWRFIPRGPQGSDSSAAR